MAVKQDEFCDVLQAFVAWQARTFVGSEFDDSVAYIPLAEFSQGALIAADAASLLRRAKHSKKGADDG